MRIKNPFTVDNLKRLQSLISQSAITLISICLIIIIIRQLFHTGVNIQPIQVPESLSKIGLNPEVSSQWLLDEILLIQNKAATIKEATNMLPEWKEINMEVPGSGFTTKTIGDVIRASLGLEQDTLSGEIIEHAGHYIIRIRLSDKSAISSDISVPEADLNPLFREAAKLAFLQIDPFIYASYLHAKGDNDAAIETANYIIEAKASDERDKVWSHNLLGIIYADAKQSAESESAYKKAIALDRKFAIAHHNLSNLYIANERYVEALEHYNFAKGLDSKLKDDKTESALLYQLARLNAQTQTLAEKEKTISMLERAAKLSPESATVWQLWGDVLLLEPNANVKEASFKFSNLVDVAPDSPEALIKLANTQFLMKKCEDAFNTYQKALAIDPGGYSELPEEQLPSALACR